MRAMRGLITQVRRREGRIGRVWRRISQSADSMLLKCGAASQLSLTQGATGTTGKKGECNHNNTSLHKKGGAA